MTSKPEAQPAHSLEGAICQVHLMFAVCWFHSQSHQTCISDGNPQLILLKCRHSHVLSADKLGT